MAPLAPLLARADVTDVWINRPCEAWVESVGGGIARVDLPGLDEGALWGLARQFAAAGHQGVSRRRGEAWAIIWPMAALAMSAWGRGLGCARRSSCRVRALGRG